MEKELGSKRTIDEIGDSPSSNISVVHRPRVNNVKETATLRESKGSQNCRIREKSHTQITNELYVNLAAEMMNPKVVQTGYGFSPDQGKFPFERLNTLGLILCPLRKPSVMEKWSPYEIAVFEGSIALYGKNFHAIQKYVESKTVKDVIEFYYEWKKTSHYKEWKKQYQPDERDFANLQ